MENSNKVFTNMVWRFAERCGAQLVQFIVSIVLARIIAPEAYGMISIVLVFASILQVFVDSGLGNALIQKKDADDLDFSSVFYFNIIWCLVLYALIFFCAPLISYFYNDPSLTSITRVLSLTIVISGVKNVQQAYISKILQFKKFFLATLLGTIMSGVAGIALALTGYGVWALVAQKIVNLFVDTVVLWITVKWRPKLMFSFSRLKELLSFGWKLLTSTLLETIYSNLRSLIIGKKYSSSDLAFYNQGQNLPNMIVTNLHSAIDSVLFPVMSNEQDKKERVKNMVRRAIKTIVYIMAPLMIGLAITAPIVVELFFTSKWLPCVPYLRLACISLMFFPIHTSNLDAIKAMGRSDLILKLEIIKKIINVILLLISMWFGVMAMAWSLFFGSIINQIINSWPNKKLLNYSYCEQLKDIFPSLLLAAFMGLCISLIPLLDLPLILTLIIQIVMGAMIYILGSLLSKIDSFQYIIQILTPFLKKIRLKKHY